MADPQVERWRQQGTMCMWYNRHHNSHREWNFSADDAACDSLLELFDLMEKSNWPSKVELQLTKPEVTADHGGTSPFKAATQLTLKYPKDRVPDNRWELSGTDGKLLLEVGLARLAEVRRAIIDIKQGGGDYSIGADGNRLWVWWWVDKLH